MNTLNPPNISVSTLPINPNDAKSTDFVVTGMFVSTRELANILESHHICISALKEYRNTWGGWSEKNFKSQQYFFIDIDNKLNDPRINDEYIARVAKATNACIIQKSARYSIENPKYHIFYKIPESTTDINMVNAINNLLLLVLKKVYGLNYSEGGYNAVIDSSVNKPCHLCFGAINKNCVGCYYVEDVLVDINNLFNLVISSIDKKNFKRDITIFINEVFDINIENSAKEEKMPVPIYNIDSGKISSFDEIYLFLSKYNNLSEISKKTKGSSNLDINKHTTPSVQDFITKITSVEFKELPVVSCRLLDDFRSGEVYLSNNETLHIANGYFNRCKRGKNTFKELIDLNSDNIIKNSDKTPRAAIQCRKSMVDRNEPYIYKCSKMCKYHSECGKNYIINTVSKRNDSYTANEYKDENTDYYEDIESVRNAMNNFIYSYFNMDSEERNTFTILNVPPGSGKTTRVLEEISKSSEALVFALPTHKLIDEKLSEYNAINKNKNREFFRTLPRPTLPEPYETALCKYERALNFKERTDVFKSFKINYTGENREEYIKNIVEYEKNYLELADNDLVITTHSKLLCHPELSEKINTIIIDENIFSKYISIENISPNDLIYFTSKKQIELFEEDENNIKAEELLSKLRNCKNNEIICLSDNDRELLKNVFNQFSLEEIANSDTSLGIIKLPKSIYFTYSAYSRSFYILNVNNLDERYKYLVLTADTIENIINDLVKTTEKTVIKKISTNNKQTVIKQFTKRSYSRYNLKKSSELLDNLTRYISSNNFDAVISYKFVIEHIKKNVPSDTDNCISTMYFGDTIGSNNLKDKKKVLIFGTPLENISKFNFEMQTKYSDFEFVDSDEKFENRRVNYRNCEFSLFVPKTIKDKFIPNYCDFVYNELLQSIGRIRPITNENSELYIMSNFILDKSIVDEYDDEFEI